MNLVTIDSMKNWDGHGGDFKNEALKRAGDEYLHKNGKYLAE